MQKKRIFPLLLLAVLVVGIGIHTAQKRVEMAEDLLKDRLLTDCIDFSLSMDPALRTEPVYSA